MNEPTGVLDLLAEVFTWVGLLVGVVVLLIRSIVGAIDGTWIRTPVVLIGEDADIRVRWVAHDGIIRERPLHRWELDELGGIDDPEMFVRKRSPERLRATATPHSARVLLVVGVIFLAVGVVAAALSILLLIVRG